MSKEVDIKRIGVFTSGGDAPGMNAAIRAVVRTASYHNLHIYGIECGYEGMIEGSIRRLDTKDVSNIIHRGGTILRTARSKEFHTKEGRATAYENLQAHDIDGLIAIGGNGTFTGADFLSKEFDIPVIGVPGTIDNDLYGTDYTIGFDTAVNTAIEAMDRIRDTADSHSRLFFVEVMGRDAGYIALSVGIGSGSGKIFLPEIHTSVESVFSSLKKAIKRKKLFSLMVVAEGNKSGGAQKLADEVNAAFEDYEPRVTIIGHLQRGGSPTAMDRVLASRLGFHAVEGILAGKKNAMVGVVNNKIKFTPFKDAITKHKAMNEDLLRMAEILAL